MVIAVKYAHINLHRYTNNNLLSSGIGHSKKEAEQQCSKNPLIKFNEL